MSEIKRYGLRSKGGYPYAVVDKNGGYVLYDDIKHLLKLRTTATHAKSAPKCPNWSDGICLAHEPVDKCDCCS